MKKIFIMLAILGGILILAGFIYTHYQTSETNGTSSYSEYYQELARECIGKTGEACCLSSVKNMANENYTVMPENGCSENSERNTLKCVDTYSWCEPKEPPSK